MKSSGILITSYEQFEQVIQTIEGSYNKIKDIFSKEKNNKEVINKTEVWTGKAQEAMYDKYAMLAENFEPITYSLNVYIKFLKKTLEDYKKADQAISDNINKIAENLNVNS